MERAWRALRAWSAAIRSVSLSRARARMACAFPAGDLAGLPLVSPSARRWRPVCPLVSLRAAAARACGALYVEPDRGDGTTFHRSRRAGLS